MQQFQAGRRDGNRLRRRSDVQKGNGKGAAPARRIGKMTRMTDRRTTSVLALAAVALAVLSTAALADRGPGKGEGPAEMFLQRFDAMDADKDGKLTQAEIDAWRAARFAAADANKDGALDKDELAALRLAEMQARAGEQAGRMMERLDKSGDGKLSAEEMPGAAGGGRLFARADADGDGAVSKAEAEAALTRLAGRMEGHRGKGHGHGPAWWWGGSDGPDDAN
jgi:hypothetical protein